VTEARLLCVAAEHAGIRLDRYLAEQLPELSRGRIQRLIHEGAVRRNGQAARVAGAVASGDQIEVQLPEPADRELRLVPRPDLPLDLLYADSAIIVLNKAAGRVVHPGTGHASDALVNALVARFPDLADTFPDSDRPGIVQRLDRDTSGVLVVARTVAAAEHLAAQFEARNVEKVYLAIVKGVPVPAEGVIDAPINRDPLRRQRMAAMAEGRAAQTAYRVLASAGEHSWLELRPVTGRTHQIRVHLAAIGHPVAGDDVYGRRDPHVGRLALHAWQLAFDHPDTGQRRRFTAVLPDDLRAALAALGLPWEEAQPPAGERPA
jgi:23S rRNA pseudouridine1911/1915/1917 synthase